MEPFHRLDISLEMSSDTCSSVQGANLMNTDALCTFDNCVTLTLTLTFDLRFFELCRSMDCEREDGELEEGELDDDEDDQDVTDAGADAGGAGDGETGELSDDNSTDDKPVDRIGE